MNPMPKSKPRAAELDAYDIPSKEIILEGISEGYRFVMSGGEGQPIDEMHREIAEELAQAVNGGRL